MKIADVADFYTDQGGGVRTYVDNKLTAAARAGHDLTVIAPGPTDSVSERDGGRVVWIQSPPLPLDPRYCLLLDRRAVHDALDVANPDVVEGSSTWTGGWFGATWDGPAKKALIFHQDPVAAYPQALLGRWLGRIRVDRLFRPYWALLRRLSRHYDATVVAGEWLANRLGGFGVHRPVAVPFGVDKAPFIQATSSPLLDDRRYELASLCGIAPTDPLLVTVSRFHPEKRLDTLFDAFEELSQDRPIGWVLFGDGHQQKMVHRRAQGVRGVHVAGFTKDRETLATSLAAADVLLHGSAAETYGLAVAEAICAGLPVVVPDAGGAHALALPGCSEVYPTGDPIGAARAVERLLARPRRERIADCERGRNHILTLDQHFEALFGFYEMLLDGSFDVANGATSSANG